MASRPFSRPRTRIYDVNYNMGENYYKPTIDRLDRKYSGRPATPPPRQESSVANDILSRHERAFADEDLPTARARAQKHIVEANAFDSRGSHISQALDMVGNDIDEETAAKLQRLRATKKVTMMDDIDLDSAVNNIKARRIKDRAEQMLDSVGISTIDNSQRKNDITYQRRTLKMSVDSSGSDSNDLTKWSKVDHEENSAAALRAKQSRARLSELEDEMNEMAEKAQVRERRVARLRQLVAENAEHSEAAAAAAVQQTTRISSRQKREALEY